MANAVRTIIYPTRDVERAKTVFSRLLDAEPHTDSPHYVGYRVGGQEIGLLPGGHERGMTGPIGYVHVKDVRSELAALIEAGAQPAQDVRDVGGGMLVATVTDADGNVLGLLQNPPG
jgi:predicted enzyme related to lactoylglutathione lyase